MFHILIFRRECIFKNSNIEKKGKSCLKNTFRKLAFKIVFPQKNHLESSMKKQYCRPSFHGLGECRTKPMLVICKKHKKPVVRGEIDYLEIVLSRRRILCPKNENQTRIPLGNC